MATPTCPECGCNEFEMRVLQIVRVMFDDDDDSHEVTDEPHGDIEWDDTTVATCSVCAHEAPLGEMKET